MGYMVNYSAIYRALEPNSTFFYNQHNEIDCDGLWNKPRNPRNCLRLRCLQIK